MLYGVHGDEVVFATGLGLFQVKVNECLRPRKGRDGQGTRLLYDLGHAPGKCAHCDGRKSIRPLPLVEPAYNDKAKSVSPSSKPGLNAIRLS